MAIPKEVQELIEPARAAAGRQIDQLVYELYGLTDKEIETVEGVN